MVEVEALVPNGGGRMKLGGALVGEEEAELLLLGEGMIACSVLSSASTTKGLV